MIARIRRLIYRIPLLSHALEIYHNVKAIKGFVKVLADNHAPPDVAIEHYLREFLHNDIRYKGTKRLCLCEFDVFSCSGDDGIIREIFHRIGTTNKFFVDIGAHSGILGNTANLLLDNWKGLWVEADPVRCSVAREKFASVIAAGDLTVRETFVSAENISNLLIEGKTPEEPDFLSIDIDGNDYWIWKALSACHPRVVEIEYHPRFRPPTRWVMKYDPEHRYSGHGYFGASLKSLELLGREKGYSLVGCTFDGVNAFFVRNDLVGDVFHEPFTAEEHYEPFRYSYLRRSEVLRDFGPFERI